MHIAVIVPPLFFPLGLWLPCVVPPVVSPDVGAVEVGQVPMKTAEDRQPEADTPLLLYHGLLANDDLHVDVSFFDT